MFSLISNYLCFLSNILTIQAMIFVMNYGQSDSFFIVLFCLCIICLSLLQFRAHLTVISINKFETAYD